MRTLKKMPKMRYNLYCTPSTGNGQHPREDLQGEITPGRREREPGWMTNPMDNVMYIIV